MWLFLPGFKKIILKVYYYLTNFYDLLRKTMIIISKICYEDFFGVKNGENYILAFIDT